MDDFGRDLGRMLMLVAMMVGLLLCCLGVLVVLTVVGWLL